MSLFTINMKNMMSLFSKNSNKQSKVKYTNLFTIQQIRRNNSYKPDCLHLILDQSYLSYCYILFINQYYQQMNTGNTFFLMIGSSSNKQPMEYQGTKAGNNPGLGNVLQDFKLFYNKLRNHKNKEHLQSSSHNKGGIHSMEGIKMWLKNKFANESKYFVLFYSGHGHSHTGNLAIDTQERPGGDDLALEQIVDIWRRQRKNRINQSKLFLILDSTSSGSWCQRLVSLRQPSIGIFASCDTLEIMKQSSDGGCFINCILGQCKNFETNFDKLSFNHNPKFINNQSQVCNLKRSDLKAINANIFQIDNLKSSQQNQDKYNPREGSTNNGSIYFTNGEVYHGQWSNKGQPHGYGKYIYNTGENYEGNWYKGQFNEIGEFKMLGGFKYIGKWKNGQMNQKGVLKFSINSEQQIQKELNMRNMKQTKISMKDILYTQSQKMISENEEKKEHQIHQVSFLSSKVRKLDKIIQQQNRVIEKLKYNQSVNNKEIYRLNRTVIQKDWEINRLQSQLKRLNLKQDSSFSFQRKNQSDLGYETRQMGRISRNNNQKYN